VCSEGPRGAYDDGGAAHNETLISGEAAIDQAVIRKNVRQRKDPRVPTLAEAVDPNTR
jgi:hypothetical protein